MCLCRLGGIIPPLARDLHAVNIAKVVQKCLDVVPLSQLDAIAVTNRPGLVLSLDVGLRHAKKLCQEALEHSGRRLPLIPVHHMEAHALTVRMVHKVIKFGNKLEKIVNFMPRLPSFIQK